MLKIFLVSKGFFEGTEMIFFQFKGIEMLFFFQIFFIS